MAIFNSYVKLPEGTGNEWNISISQKNPCSEDFANKKPGGSWYLFPFLMINPKGSEAKMILNFTPEVPMSIETWHLFL